MRCLLHYPARKVYHLSAFISQSFFKPLFSFVGASIRPRRLIKIHLIKNIVGDNSEIKWNLTTLQFSLCRVLYNDVHSFTSARFANPHCIFFESFGVLPALKVDDNKSFFFFERFVMIKWTLRKFVATWVAEEWQRIPEGKVKS